MHKRGVDNQEVEKTTMNPPYHIRMGNVLVGELLYTALQQTNSKLYAKWPVATAKKHMANLHPLIIFGLYNGSKIISVFT